ncbi:MAG: PD40 domain-containing protein [Pseudomonadales bacterium]|nr:PD40 domain-containing protein [Pseudomonadales bacterium]
MTTAVRSLIAMVIALAALSTLRVWAGSEGVDRSVSSDGQLVTFVKQTPDDRVETAAGDVEATEIWTSRADGSEPRMWLHGHSGSTPESTLAGFRSPQFSPDGKQLYFLSMAWATSGAVHSIDLQSGRLRFVCPGNSLEIIQEGEYKGNLMVEQHRYFMAGGAYDWLWLIQPDGQTVGAIAPDDEARSELEKAFRELYVPASLTGADRIGAAAP